MATSPQFKSASEVTRALRINTTVAYYNNYPQDQKRAYASTYTSFRAGVTGISGYTPGTTGFLGMEYTKGFVQTSGVGERNGFDRYTTIVFNQHLAGQVLYAGYPQGSTPSPPYITVYSGDFTVTVAGARGGAGYGYAIPGNRGGLVTYTFSNVPAGTSIYYIVGGTGQESYNTGGGGGGSAVSIGDIAVIAGGGRGASSLGTYDSLYPQGGGGDVWGSSPIPNLLTSLVGISGTTLNLGGAGGGANPGSGSGSGPTGIVITPGGGVNGNGYVRIMYAVSP